MHIEERRRSKGEKVGVKRQAGAAGERIMMVAVMGAVGKRHRKNQGIGEQRYARKPVRERGQGCRACAQHTVSDFQSTMSPATRAVRHERREERGGWVGGWVGARWGGAMWAKARERGVCGDAG